MPGGRAISSVAVCPAPVTASGVGVDVGIGVSVGNGVFVGVGVILGVSVTVGVCVGSGVFVGEGVSVGADVLTGSGVCVGSDVSTDFGIGEPTATDADRSVFVIAEACVVSASSLSGRNSATIAHNAQSTSTETSATTACFREILSFLFDVV
jgi:hypothetical protein